MMAFLSGFVSVQAFCMRRLIPILTVCALPTLALAQPANVLRNPGFEHEPAGEKEKKEKTEHEENAEKEQKKQIFPGWTIFGPKYGPTLSVNVWSESGGTAHGGAKYIKVSQDLTKHSANSNGVYQDYMSGPGATYSAHGWVYAPSADLLAGQNSAWIEVTFRDANANVLALYRSSIITNLAGGGSPLDTWVDLPVTRQCDPKTCLPTKTVPTLVAPAGTYFVRYQVVVRGNGNGTGGGSVYFDDLQLASTGGTPYSGWNMTWSDEFNGTSVDTKTWTYDIGTGAPALQGWGNHELEYYTSRANNVNVSDGLLHIVAQRESYEGSNYTSARLKSQGSFSAKYGRIEWRAKMPAGFGCWPALWLLGTNITTISWPGCGEIDIMENRGRKPSEVGAAIHFGSSAGGVYQFIKGEEADAASAFHTYAMDWSTNAMMFYVDGHLYDIETKWSSSVGPYPYPFNKQFFFIMNLAIGGAYLGWPSQEDINAGTPFPVEMQVDYLRIYQLKDKALVTLPSPPPPLKPSANSVLVDFESGDTKDVTPSPTNGLHWNKVLTKQSGEAKVPLNGSTQPIALVNAANENSGITLAITATGWGAGASPNWAGYKDSYPAVLRDMPSTALRDGMAVSGGATMTVTLSGLNPDLTYNLRVYGANTIGTGKTTDVGNSQTDTLTVGTSPSPASVRFNPFYNGTTVVAWTDVKPGAGGQIAFTVTETAGGSGGALNFMEVTPIRQ